MNQNQPSANTITVTSSSFQGNRATAGDGGAIRAGGILQTLQVNGSCTFDNNRAVGAGGAIFASCKTFDIGAALDQGAKTLFQDNQASGGAAVSWVAPSINNLAVVNSLTITNVEFIGNAASIAGGGVRCELSNTQNTTTASITNCLFYLNTARFTGGGILLLSNTTQNAWVRSSITNSTIYRNSTLGEGGGIAIIASSEPTATNAVILTSNTIYQNTALNEGGGVYIPVPLANPGQAVPPVVHNTIVAGNNATTGKDASGAVNSQGFNLIGITNGSSGWQGASSPEPDQQGTLNAPLNANLDPLGIQANNSLGTRTIAVPNGTPAFRAGDPALLTVGDPDDPRRRDQRGRLRTGTVTVGAFDPDAADRVAANNAPLGGNTTVVTLENTPYAFSRSDPAMASSRSKSPVSRMLGCCIMLVLRSTSTT